MTVTKQSFILSAQVQGIASCVLRGERGQQNESQSAVLMHGLRGPVSVKWSHRAG